MQETLFLFLVLAFLVVLGYLVSRIVGLVFGAIGAGIVMGLVPLVLDKILGIHAIPFTLTNTLLFFVLGVVSYLAYHFAKMFFGVSSLVGRIVLLPARMLALLLGLFRRKKKNNKKGER